MPDNVLSAGHLFDSTPAQAEVSLAGGLSSTGAYDGAGTCSSLYCHGDGQTEDGTITDGSNTTCASCHPDSSSGSWSSMSGEHSRHMGEGFACADCHAGVTDESQSILDPDLHVDGAVSLIFSKTTMYAKNGYCVGYCHGEFHFNSWY